MLRTQAVVSASIRDGPLPQPPPEHCGSWQVRWRTALCAQGLAHSHAPHGSQLVIPQLFPSVARLHGAVPVRGTARQVPPEHVRSVHVWLMVPLVAQEVPYEQVPKGSQLVMPQLCPSVAREQGALTTVGVATQALEAHV